MNGGKHHAYEGHHHQHNVQQAEHHLSEIAIELKKRKGAYQ